MRLETLHVNLCKTKELKNQYNYFVPSNLFRDYIKSKWRNNGPYNIPKPPCSGRPISSKGIFLMEIIQNTSTTHCNFIVISTIYDISLISLLKYKSLINKPLFQLNITVNSIVNSQKYELFYIKIKIILHFYFWYKLLSRNIIFELKFFLFIFCFARTQK